MTRALCEVVVILALILAAVELARWGFRKLGRAICANGQRAIEEDPWG